MPIPALSSSRRRCAPRSSPGLGSSRHHPVRRRCRLRRAPSFAPRRAVVFAWLRTAPSPPPAACCARPRAASAALPATQSPWRLPSAGFPGVDSPLRSPSDSWLFGRRSAFRLHTPLTKGEGLPWPSVPSLSGPPRVKRGRAVVGPRGLRAKLAIRHRPVPTGPPLATTDMRRVAHETRPQCARGGRELRRHAPQLALFDRPARRVTLGSRWPRRRCRAVRPVIGLAQDRGNRHSSSHPASARPGSARPRPDAGPDRPGQDDGARP